MKALLITSYYNCVIEYILLNYIHKIDALIFMEVDTITVSKMVEKYHLTNILCLSYEEYMLRNDIHIIDTDLYKLNILFTLSYMSFNIIQKIDSKYSNSIIFYKYALNKSLYDVDKQNELYQKNINKKFCIFKNIQDDMIYYVYQRNKNKDVKFKQTYYLSWFEYFFSNKIVYIQSILLLNFVYDFLSPKFQKYIYESVDKLF